MVDDFGNGEVDAAANGGKQGRRSNPPPGQPGHVDLEAYLVTYAFLPESPVVTAVAYRNTSLKAGDVGAWVDGVSGWVWGGDVYVRICK